MYFLCFGLQKSPEAYLLGTGKAPNFLPADNFLNVSHRKSAKFKTASEEVG